MPPFVHEVLRSPGNLLDPGTRAFFEPRLGHDFSKVRVHTDTQAAESSDAVGALAYTVGNDVVFGAGRYAPTTPGGQHLLAHELAHVVEQINDCQGRHRLQRFPVFSDETCEGGEKKEKITADVDLALKLVQNALSALSNPETVAAQLDRFFHIDVTQEAHLVVLVPMIQKSLTQLEAKLAGPVESHCASGRGEGGALAWVHTDNLEYGVTYNRNTFNFLNSTQDHVDTIIHEYTHLIGVGHGEPEGDPISNKHSLKIRWPDMWKAMNSAETWMRFVRSVT